MMILKNQFSTFESNFFEYFFKKKLTQWIKKDFSPNRFNYFSNESEIRRWKNPDSDYFKNLLERMCDIQTTYLENNELKLFDLYCGFYYIPLNNRLREIEDYRPDKAKIENDIIELDKYLSKFRTNENLIAIRRIPSEIADKSYRAGNSFQEKGFLSTSLNLMYRKNTNGVYKQINNECIMVLKIPKGTCAAYVEESIPSNRQREEYELLIQRESKIHILSKYKLFSNRLILAELSNAKV